MHIVPAIEAKIRRAIRDARARDPLISVVDLQATLEKKFNRTFTWKYVSKLADKIYRQALVEADRTQIEERLAFTRENYRIVRDRLMEIITWAPDPDNPIPLSKQRPPYNEDVINAGKTIVLMDLAILKAEMDNGLYRKPIEMLAKEFQYEPLPGDVRAVIVAAWRRGGMLPTAAIEQMVPEKVTIEALA